jgi:hypothetical protein
VHALSVDGVAQVAEHLPGLAPRTEEGRDDRPGSSSSSRSMILDRSMSVPCMFHVSTATAGPVATQQNYATRH